MSQFLFRPVARALLGLLLGAVQVHAAEREVVLSAEQVKALGVTAIPLSVVQGEGMQGLPAQVVVPNAQLRMVSAPLGGVIEQVMVASQQRVQKGQVLARLLSPALAEAQRGYLQAVAQTDLARTQLARDERLFKEGIIAESRVQVTRSHWVETSAALSERVQALRLAGLNDQALKDLRSGRLSEAALSLRAPIDGVVLEQLAVVGQRVEAAAPMFRIGKLEPLWLEIQVPAAQLSQVREGALVTTRAGARAQVIALPRNINAGTQSALVRAQTIEGASSLMPGQAVEVVIATSGQDGRWSVPNGALMRSGKVVSVFVRSAKGFRPVDVRLVREGMESSVIEGPVKAGELIAVSGVSALKASLAGIGAP